MCIATYMCMHIFSIKMCLYVFYSTAEMQLDAYMHACTNKGTLNLQAFWLLNPNCLTQTNCCYFIIIYLIKLNWPASTCIWAVSYS